MRAVILAAGEGKRMHPITLTRPKPLIPIGGRPILEHLIISLEKAGLKRITIVIGYQAEKVRQYFGNGEKWEVRIEYVLQKEQLGTAHAILQAHPYIKDDEFLVLNGDVMFSDEDLREFINGEPPMMGLSEGDERDVGIVIAEEGEVKRIIEKPRGKIGGLINAGIYLLDREIFEYACRISPSPRGEYELTDALQILVDKGGRKLGWRRIKRWFNLTYPWDILKVNQNLLEEIGEENLGKVEEGAHIKGKVKIGRGTRVRAGSYIEGPAIIGEECDIGPNSYVRPFTSIGDGCHIGTFCEVKNSVIMKGTKIPHHNYVGDSIIGENCNLGAGTKIANLRLDKKNVVIDEVETGLRKLGAIIGDKVETGINVSIDVGTLIGPDTFIGPGVMVAGKIEPGSRIV